MGRPRGNPNLGKTNKENALSADKRDKGLMKQYQAAAMIDKNSRTMVKIVQLLDACDKPEAAALDPDGNTSRHIEMLKKRVLRRLQKLAKWGDASENDRLYDSSNKYGSSRNQAKPFPYPHSLPIDYNSMNSSTATTATVSTININAATSSSSNVAKEDTALLFASTSVTDNQVEAEEDEVEMKVESAVLGDITVDNVEGNGAVEMNEDTVAPADDNVDNGQVEEVDVEMNKDTAASAEGNTENGHIDDVLMKQDDDDQTLSDAVDI